MQFGRRGGGGAGRSVGRPVFSNQSSQCNGSKEDWVVVEALQNG